MNQTFLDEIVNKKEAEFFLHEVSNWDSHRPLLYLALELTKNSNAPILELGCGDGSTPYLHNYIQTDKRNLVSFDTKEFWLNKFIHFKSEKHNFVYLPDNYGFNKNTQEWYDKSPEIINWLDDVTSNNISVCLVDHACGERRHSDLKRIHKKCDIMIIHDSEPQATGYMMNKVWPLFKYVIHFKQFGAWTTMVSNRHDVTKFDKMKIKEFELNV